MVKYSDGTNQKIMTDSKSTGSEEGLRGNGFAITALVCGILGFVVPGLGLLSIIFGGIGRNKKYKGRKMALTGMILGLINLLLVLILLASY
jgi:hypothetical protein